MTAAPGAWPSPLSAAAASAVSTQYGQLAVPDAGRTVGWDAASGGRRELQPR